MSVDPLVIQAAHTYVGQPTNYGTDTNLIRLVLEPCRMGQAVYG